MHEPDQTYLNSNQIMFVEPVGTQFLQVLGCGCQVELLGNVPQSSQACLTQLNLLLEFGKQGFDLVTRSLGAFVIPELTNIRSRSNSRRTGSQSSAMGIAMPLTGPT